MIRVATVSEMSGSRVRLIFKIDKLMQLSCTVAKTNPANKVVEDYPIVTNESTIQQPTVGPAVGGFFCRYRPGGRGRVTFTDLYY